MRDRLRQHIAIGRIDLSVEENRPLPGERSGASSHRGRHRQTAQHRHVLMARNQSGVSSSKPNHGRTAATLNDVQRVPPEREAQVLAVYVGGPRRAQVSSRPETRAWGFSTRPSRLPKASTRATGSSRGGVRGRPRTAADRWRTRRGRASDSRPSHVPHTSIRHRTGQMNVSVKRAIPHRLRFEVIENVAPLPLGEESVISSEVAEALRLSAIDQGETKSAPAVGSLSAPRPRRSAISSPSAPSSLVVSPRQTSTSVRTISTWSDPSSFPLHEGFRAYSPRGYRGRARLGSRSHSDSGSVRVATPLLPSVPTGLGPSSCSATRTAFPSDDTGRRAWQVPEVLRFMLGPPDILSIPTCSSSTR